MICLVSSHNCLWINLHIECLYHLCVVCSFQYCDTVLINMLFKSKTLLK
uniref:Uncharacterized protein n=1 Tax=Arundo donax TaxID=35708 RepID=A0A0A9GV67_ARUDO